MALPRVIIFLHDEKGDILGLRPFWMLRRLWNPLNDRKLIITGKVAVTPQQDVYWPTLSTIDHIYFFSLLHGVRLTQDEAMIILKSVGLATSCDKPAKQLSGGMKRRLTLACSLSTIPSIVLADEPCSGLDPATRTSILSVLEVAAGSSCVLLSTHSLGDAEDLCDHIVLMSHGTVVKQGGSSEMKEEMGGGYIMELSATKDEILSSMKQSDHIYFFSLLHGVRLTQDEAMIILKSVGLATSCDKPAKQLSGGMKRRLTLACSLSTIPSIVLADEPCSGLDPATRTSILSVLEVAAGSSCVLLSTHSLGDAEDLCDHIVLMSHGTVVKQGGSSEMKEEMGGGYIMELSATKDEILSSMKQSDQVISLYNTVL
ncbi:hypothetical protein ADUPG1_012830 [Aduncisulcus paluster]|uniref:ABC transporter domain-containing protein n=1 Tax=Aduncisulcus paluster TaxID=2918883 RepID=A0ABQ5K411_9EUKA|nr:hypothetical protein ADUPG1_012830 [Aduncisulcus paluster]